MTDFKYLIRQNRSYRRFNETISIAREVLAELVDMARLIPSASNLQPLKYIICSDREKCQLIFRSLHWAGYLTDWPGPANGERPSAYVIILSDKSISLSVKWDHGIAAHTILLGASSMGYGGCIIGAINREKLREDLAIPENLEIELVTALGVPAEEVVIEEVNSGSSIKYYRDSRGIHHVPKRKLQDILLDI